MQYQDFVPVSYQPNPSGSDSSLDFSQNSREQHNSGSRRSKLPPVSPKSGVRRQSQICGVPLLETTLLPSLRDTIDRMTRPPSRVASAPSPAPSSPESLRNSRKGDLLPSTGYRSPAPQRVSPLPPSSNSIQSTETIVSPFKPVPKTLKSALRSPKTPNASNATSSPALTSPAFRSVKSILGRKCKTPPSSKNQGISSKDIFVIPSETKTFQSNSRNRSHAVPGDVPPLINSLSGQQQSTNHHITPSEAKELQTTPKARDQSQKSNIPRPAVAKKRSQILQPESATEESDIELQYEANSRNRRRLMVANAEVYPSSSSASGLASDPSIVDRTSARSPAAAAQYPSLRRETKWSRKGLGLTLDLQADSSADSIYSGKIPSLSGGNAKDIRSTSHEHTDPENERRQAALLRLVSGLDLERQDGQRVDADGSDHDGEGVALPTSFNRLENRSADIDDDVSLYDDDFEEDGRYHLRLGDNRRPTADMQSNAHTSDFSKQSQKYRCAIYGSPDETIAGSVDISPPLPRKSPSRTPVIRRSIHDGELSPAALKRRSIYIEQTTSPFLDNHSAYHEEQGKCTISHDTTSYEDERGIDKSSIITDTANAILARARRAFGIPQSESDRFRENVQHRDYRSSLAESELSSAGSTFWRTARAEDPSDAASTLSVGAASLFRGLSDDSNRRSYDQQPTTAPTSSVLILRAQDGDLKLAKKQMVLEDPKSPTDFPSFEDRSMPAYCKPLDDVEIARQRIIGELCTSEETFVARLHVCVQLFILPLRVKNRKSWVDGVPSDVAHFLDWFEDIANFHIYDISRALGNIQRGVTITQDHNIPCVSEQLLQLIPKLDVYQPYLVRLSSVATMVRQMVRDGGNDFGEFVSIQQQSPECGGWGLEAFLLEPMNRLTKYCDIFSRLLSSTPKNHPDYLPTFSLLQSIDVVVRVMTEVKIREDEYDLMKELISAIKGLPLGLQLATRERRLLHHGCVYIFEEDGQGNDGLSNGTPVVDNQDVVTSTRQTFRERAGNRISKLASAVQAWDTRRGRSGSIKSNVSSCAGSIRSDDFRGSPETKSLNNATSSELEPTCGALRPAQLLLFSDVAILATPITQDSAKSTYQLMNNFGLSGVFHAAFETGTSEDGFDVAVDLISLDADLKMSSMRLTSVRVKIMVGKVDDALSLQRQIELWRSAFHQCSQFTLRLLSHPTVPNTEIAGEYQDLTRGPGLPVPKSPSVQALDMENSSPTQQEREKRSWWSLRFQQVLQGMSGP